MPSKLKTQHSDQSCFSALPLSSWFRWSWFWSLCSGLFGSWFSWTASSSSSWNVFWCVTMISRWRLLERQQGLVEELVDRWYWSLEIQQAAPKSEFWLFHWTNADRFIHTLSNLSLSPFVGSQNPSTRITSPAVTLNCLPQSWTTANNLPTSFALNFSFILSTGFGSFSAFQRSCDFTLSSFDKIAGEVEIVHFWRKSKIERGCNRCNMSRILVSLTCQLRHIAGYPPKTEEFIKKHFVHCWLF